MINTVFMIFWIVGIVIGIHCIAYLFRRRSQDGGFRLQPFVEMRDPVLLRSVELSVVREKWIHKTGQAQRLTRAIQFVLSKWAISKIRLVIKSGIARIYNTLYLVRVLPPYHSEYLQFHLFTVIFPWSTSYLPVSMYNTRLGFFLN